MGVVQRVVVSRPRIVLLILALGTVWLGGFAVSIRLDSSLEALLPQDDPEKRYAEEIRRVFGSDEIGVIGVFHDETVFRPETLRKIERITEEVARIDGVADVVSLMNVPDPAASVVEPPPLVPSIPKDAGALRELHQKVLDRPLFVGNLISADGKAAAINVFFRDMDEEEFFRRGIDEAVQNIADEARGPEEVYYTGLPHFRVHAVKAMWRDLTWLVPLTLLVILVVLFASFRSARGVLLPMLSSVVSLVWTLGAMVLTGTSLSLGSIALPPLVLVVGTVYSLHVVAEYVDRARTGGDVPDLVRRTLDRIGTPAFITAFTTVLGFLSLAVNRIPSIRDLGLFAALGIALAWVFAIVLVPALLTQLPLPRAGATGSPSSPRLETWLRTAGRFDIRNRRGILLVAGAVVVLSVWQTFHIRVDTNYQSFFRKSDPIRIATDVVNERLVGSMAFSVVVEGPGDEPVKKWDTLRRIRELQTWLESQPGVDETVSLVDYLELMDRGAQTGAGGFIVTEEGELVEATAQEATTTFWEKPSQLDAIMPLVVANPRRFQRVVDPGFERANVLVRTTLSRSRKIAELAHGIERFGRQQLPPGFSVHPTGSLVLLARSSRDVISGQVQSLGLAMGVIFVILSVMFLSFRAGVLAMVPNVFPIVIFFGLVGATGTDLNLGTSIIAAIALGIAVDDTIHLLSRLSDEVKRRPGQREAILETLASVGKPVLYTTALLVPGFLALSLSTFVPIQEFGVLSATTIAMAFVGDVIVLPALVSTIRIITLWDLLNLRLGPDPQRTIPLFATLRPYQAKIVALLAELRRVPAGEAVIRKGDQGDAMFVIIDGRAEVVVGGDGERRRIRALHRGDVFGEMGLVRSHERTADVVAVEDVELLALNRRFLDRLLARYPFTANKILMNVARILSDRLEEETKRSG